MEKSIKKFFNCEICNSGFTTKSNLKKHSLSVHEEKKPFKCDICDYNFSQKSNMKSHIASVHEEKKAVL